MKRRIFGILAAVVATCALTSVNALAQCPASVFAGGLRAPTKIIFSTQNNLLVAEQGYGPNTGRVSIIDVNSTCSSLPGSSEGSSMIEPVTGRYGRPSNV